MLRVKDGDMKYYNLKNPNTDLDSEGDIYFLYSDDDLTFTLNDSSIATDEFLKKIVYRLSHPWEYSLVQYIIYGNYEDDSAYTNYEEPKSWICEYYVVVFDGEFSSCYGYGSTPKEALDDCQKILKYLQDNYKLDSD